MRLTHNDRLSLHLRYLDDVLPTVEEGTYDGPIVVMSPIGYVNIWADGDVTANGATVANVAAQPDQMVAARAVLGAAGYPTDGCGCNADWIGDAIEVHAGAAPCTGLYVVDSEDDEGTLLLIVRDVDVDGEYVDVDCGSTTIAEELPDMIAQVIADGLSTFDRE